MEGPIYCIELLNSIGELSEPEYGGFLKSFVWLSMDHSKENFKNNYLIFKHNYFKIASFFLLTFLITTYIL
jgi:hypothetical protein